MRPCTYATRMSLNRRTVAALFRWPCVSKSSALVTIGIDDAVAVGGEHVVRRVRPTLAAHAHMNAPPSAMNVWPVR